MLIKKKKTTTINPINDDNRCFQYVFNIFINNYNWKGIKYPSKIEDWKKFEKKNNSTIALNILYIKEKEICRTYISKTNSYCKKEIILLMFPN